MSEPVVPDVPVASDAAVVDSGGEQQTVGAPSMDDLDSIAPEFFETRRYAPSDQFATDSDGLPVVSEDSTEDPDEEL